MFWTEVDSALEPLLARLHHVQVVPIGHAERPFFRLMPWRVKRRDSLLRIIAAPCSPTIARTSRR